ncbi:hypothetical protein TeGR_g8870, partial [Tetraparma gracilis]
DRKAPAPPPAGEDKENAPAPAPAKKRYDPTAAKLRNEARRQTAQFAAGCFWSVELAFQRVPGVFSTRAGYTGGTVADPTYEDVKTGKSGHAEAVEVVYDPELVTFEQLLEAFWGKHDATSKNKQGNDKGAQYRSGIYTTTEEQMSLALASKERQKALLDKPWHKIHTEILEATTFYPAEEYHQQYLSEKGGRYGKKQSAAKMCSDPIRCYG